MFQKKKKVLRAKEICRVCLLCCLSLLFYGCGSQAGFYVEQQDAAQTAGSGLQSDESGGGQSDESGQTGKADPSGAAGTSEQSGRSGAADSQQTLIYVQVSGAVEHPGVYQLPEGSRIFEAVELAGGMTDAADINALNQAELLCDGQMIYVYAIGEKELAGDETDAEPEDDGLVNLNTASREQLMTLPGIGASKAESIIAYRKEHGAFETIEDIMNIEGIKEGVFSKIKDHIKVN